MSNMHNSCSTVFFFFKKRKSAVPEDILLKWKTNVQCVDVTSVTRWFVSYDHTCHNTQTMHVKHVWLWKNKLNKHTHMYLTSKCCVQVCVCLLRVQNMMLLSSPQREAGGVWRHHCLMLLMTVWTITGIQVHTGNYEEYTIVLLHTQSKY